MWIGLCACLFFIALELIGLWWSVSWASRTGAYYIVLAPGMLMPVWRATTGTPAAGEPDLQRWLNLRGGGGWKIEKRSNIYIWKPNIINTRRWKSSHIPLWLLFLPCAVSTVALWRRGRKPPPNHCLHCCYNLTGNVSGRCPECGEAIG